MMLKVEGFSGADRGAVASILVELLGSAESALSADNGKARQLITTATAILTAGLEERREADTAASSRASSNSALAPWQTRRVLQHIDANLDGPITIEDLARLARLSPSYFAR